MWKELRETANAANAKIAARCDELGIHPDLRPRIVQGFGRPSIDSTRRAQLTDELTGWIEAKIRDERQPNLDLATTRQLLDEVAARIDTHQ